MDETEKMPMELIAKMGEVGMFGIPIPRTYGGAGGDYLGNAICVEELAKISATAAFVISAHTSINVCGLYEFGTENQKRKYLGDMASGKKMSSFCLTEANSGSDASNMQTTARKDGDHYIINGSKLFITNAMFADIFIVAAVTDKNKKNKGITSFILEKGTPGFSVGKEEHKMGLRASSTCEIVFENVAVPKENILGTEGEGFVNMLKLLDGGRITIAAQAVGIAQCAIDETVKYVKERKQFGRPLSSFQNTQFKIAEMQTKTDAARMLMYRAVALKEQKRPHTLEASMAKLFASEVANEVTGTAVRMFGGYGYTRAYPVEKMMRDAKGTEIYEGTSEIQKTVISRAMKVV
jgi:butyryl-CoA dehydrogenase